MGEGKGIRTLVRFGSFRIEDSGRVVPPMVNIADLYSLFGEIAGID